MTLSLVVVADVPAEAVAAFQAYEARVLPLLARYGGRLERRLRTDDARTEVHVLSFASPDAYQAYVDDEERQAHRTLLDGRGVELRVLSVHDVDPAGQAG